MELYFTLQVPMFSSIPAVSSAFRKLALRHHPDKVESLQKNVFDAIVHAHDILSCKDSKHNYDLVLRARLANGEVSGFEEPAKVNMLRIKSNVLPKLDEYKMYFIAYLQCADRLRLNQCKEEREERECNLTLLLSKWNLETNCQHSFEDCEIPFERAVSASTEAAIAAGCCTPNSQTNGTTCHLLRCVLNKQICATCFLIHVHHEKNGSSELHFAIKSLISKLLGFQLVTQFDLYNIICKILLLLQNAAAKNYVFYLRLLGPTFWDLYKDVMKNAYHMKYEFDLEEDFDSMLKNVKDATFSDQLAKGTLPIHIYNIVSGQKELRKSLTNVLFVNDAANQLRKLAFDVLQEGLIQPLEIHKVSSALLACALLRGSTMRPSDPKARRATEMVLLMVCQRIAQWSVQSSSSWFTTYACFHALRFVHSLETVPFQEMKSVIDMLESGLENATRYFYWCPRELMLSFLDICDQFAFFQTQQTKILSILASAQTTCQELKLSHQDILLRNHKTSLTSTTTVKQCGKDETKDADSDDDDGDDTGNSDDQHMALWNSRDDQRMSLIESVLASLGWNMVDYVCNFSSDCHYQLQNSSRFWSFGMDLSIPLHKNPTANLYTTLRGFEFNAETAQLTLRQEVFDSQKHSAWQLAHSSADVKEMLSLCIHQTSFSLDPISKDLEFAPFQQMVVAPKRISGSEYEKAQFAADYWLKALINGATVQMAPPFRTKRLLFDQLPDGLKTILETYHKNSTLCLSRFWIECEEVPSLDDNPVVVKLCRGQVQLKDELRVIQEQQRTTIKYTLGEPIMVVKTRDMEWVNGQLQDINDGKMETPWDIFVTSDLLAFETCMQAKPSVRSMAIMSSQKDEDDFFGLSKCVKIWFYEHGQISKIYQSVTIPSRFRDFLQFKQSPVSPDLNRDLFGLMLSVLGKKLAVSESKCEQVTISCAQLTQEFVEFVCRHCKRNTYYSANQRLAFQLTKYYDTVAQYFPAWNRLKQLAKISAAIHEVEKMRLYQRHYLKIVVAQRDKHCSMDDYDYQEYGRLNTIATHHQKVLHNIASIVPDFADKNQEKATKTCCNLVPAVQLQNKTRFINGGVRLAPSVRLQSDAEFAMNSLIRYPCQSTFAFNSACNNAKQLISELYSASTFASTSCDVSGIRNLMRDIQFAEESARKTRAMQQDYVPLNRHIHSACGGVPFATPSFSSKPVPFANQRATCNDPLRFAFAEETFSPFPFEEEAPSPFSAEATNSRSSFSSLFAKSTPINSLNKPTDSAVHPCFNPFSPDFINTPSQPRASPVLHATNEQKIQDAKDMLNRAKKTWNDMVEETKKKINTFPILQNVATTITSSSSQSSHPITSSSSQSSHPNPTVHTTCTIPVDALPAGGKYTRVDLGGSAGFVSYIKSRTVEGNLHFHVNLMRAPVPNGPINSYLDIGTSLKFNDSQTFMKTMRQISNEAKAFGVQTFLIEANIQNERLSEVMHRKLAFLSSRREEGQLVETFLAKVRNTSDVIPQNMPTPKAVGGVLYEMDAKTFTLSGVWQTTRNKLKNTVTKFIEDKVYTNRIEYGLKRTAWVMTGLAAVSDFQQLFEQIKISTETGNWRNSGAEVARIGASWMASRTSAIESTLIGTKVCPPPPNLKIICTASFTIVGSFLGYEAFSLPFARKLYYDTLSDNPFFSYWHALDDFVED